MDANHVEAVKEVLAELAAGHPLLQVLVGGGDDAHVHPHRRVPADPIELAVCQHAQQPGLRLRGHVADLVEEESAAVGLLEAPLAPRRGAGKSPLFVAEELRFHEIPGNGGHIQRDARPGRAGAVPVQGPGNQLLAGAGLAVDQDRDAAVSQPADGPEDLLHGRRFADDFRARALVMAIARGGLVLPGVGEGPLGDRHHLVDIEGLGQVLEGALLVGGNRAVQVRVRCGDDDRQPGMVLREAPEEFEAVGPGHADIADYRVRFFVIEALEHMVTARKALTLYAGLTQGALEHPADRLIVVDDPDFGGARHGILPAGGRG